MKFKVFTATMVLTVLLFAAPSPALAQGNFSLLFEGTAAGDVEFYRLDTTTTTLNDFDFRAKNPVFPGFEVRFFQNRRVTLGVSYSQWKLDSPTQHWPELTDETGRELVGTTLTGEADGSVLLAKMYVNILTKGKIRPFVSFGAGLNKIKSQFRHETWLDPMLREGLDPDDFAFDPNTSYDPNTGIITVVGSEQKNWPTLSGGAGVNIFPSRYAVISMSANYLNGWPVFIFGAGITF